VLIILDAHRDRSKDDDFENGHRLADINDGNLVVHGVWSRFWTRVIYIDALERDDVSLDYQFRDKYRTNSTEYVEFPVAETSLYRAAEKLSHLLKGAHFILTADSDEFDHSGRKFTQKEQSAYGAILDTCWDLRGQMDLAHLCASPRYCRVERAREVWDFTRTRFQNR
jgi:hypothetical protein